MPCLLASYIHKLQPHCCDNEQRVFGFGCNTTAMDGAQAASKQSLEIAAALPGEPEALHRRASRHPQDVPMHVHLYHSKESGAETWKAISSNNNSNPKPSKHGNLSHAPLTETCFVYRSKPHSKSPCHRRAMGPARASQLLRSPPKKQSRRRRKSRMQSVISGTVLSRMPCSALP